MLSDVLANRWVDEKPNSAEAIADGELAISACSSAQAFAALYLRYVDAIHAHCYWRLGSKERAEDATSQVFAQALAGLPRFDARKGTFRSWIFTIAHRVLIDEYRAAKPSTMLDAARDIPDSSASLEELVVANECREALLGALHQLTPRERQVVNLRLAGLTGPEIARVLGCSTAAIGVAQFRAISHLRTLLGVDIDVKRTNDV